MSSSRSDVVMLRAADAPFGDNAAHLRAEIDWLHVLIRSHVRARAREEDGPLDEFAGLYISRDEIDRYLDEPPGVEGDDSPDSAEAASSHVDVWRRRAVLDARVRHSCACGVDLRLDRLGRAFDLDDESRVALLCAAAADLDPRVSRAFAYLQNDATHKRPSFALLVRLVTGRAAEPVTLRRLFGPQSALISGRLIDPGTESPQLPLQARDAVPAAGVLEFLLGLDVLPPSIANVVDLVPDLRELDDGFAYHRHHAAVLDALVRCRRGGGRLPLTYLSGPSGAGRSLIAESLAARLGRGLLRVHWPRLRGAANAAEEIGRLVNREARLRGCLVLIENVDEAASETDTQSAKAVLQTLVRTLADAEVLATGAAPAADLRYRLGIRLLGFEVPYPTAAEREQAWRRLLPPALDRQIGADVPELAAKFRFTPGQIAQAIRIVEMAAPRDDAGEPVVEPSDLHARCREEAQRGLHLYCQKIVPRFGWDDIVLPADTCVQLREICDWVRHGTQVYEGWGFGRKLAVTNGVTVLFSGPSGTGKTMSAEVIAGDLQLDLFRVDLSRVVSKYIGETEKNLARIFEQSAASNCILFFDEADALFGKRTEVKDAHDRYANIEVNYLLSQMDRYEGLIIVATNLKTNLDAAFIRRFSHVVEYPVPDERLREAIWRKSFPERTPVAGDVDFGFLAQRLTLSGANIKNIALASAFLASADARDVGMDHVIRATRREYQKIGRICSKSDFGPYYGLVREVDTP